VELSNEEEKRYNEDGYDGEDGVDGEDADDGEDGDDEDEYRGGRVSRKLLRGWSILHLIYGVASMSIFVMAVSLRVAFRTKFAIGPTLLSCCGSFGGIVEDIITTYFCHCCSLAQMARHAWPGQTSCDICSEPEVVSDVNMREDGHVIEAIVV